MNWNKSWVIPVSLSKKDKEILFLTAEAAGTLIYENSRNYSDDYIFPYVMYLEDYHNSGSGILCSGSSNVLEQYPHVTYEEILEELRTKIKQSSI